MKTWQFDFSSNQHTSSDDGSMEALEIFRAASVSVPAYRDFLKRHSFDPDSVRSCDDFQQIPVMDKSNYLDQYSLGQLSWNGDPSRGALIHASSGTSGTASYWPCGEDELRGATRYYRQVLSEGFGVGPQSSRTLLMICFGMGTWIAGSYTATCALLLRLEGLPITIVTPGFNQVESLALLKRLAPEFSQVIVAGIPSFVKDLLETWRRNAPDDKTILSALLAGEGFPESWRNYLSELCGQSGGIVLSLLGSADAGLIGFETDDTIRLRRLAEHDETFCKVVFRQRRVPAVLSYDPQHRYLEVWNDQLLVTANRTVPLIRYNTRDLGGLLPASFVNATVSSETRSSKSNFPSVFLFGRGDRNGTLYGANIYAEYVQEFLIHDTVAAHTTGRFRLETVWRSGHEQQLRILLELADGIYSEDCDINSWTRLLTDLLLRRSSEFARISIEYGDRAVPQLVLRPFHCQEHFPETHRKNS